MTNDFPLTLYYINTAPLSASPDPTTLPLLSTLRPEDQTAITRFHRPPDRHMSLASNLLKYLFIHRTAQIPWSEITVSRTPPPHKRPFWDPTTSPTHVSNRNPRAAGAIEFNVSHQAGLVVLAGCPVSTPPSTVITTPDGPLLSTPATLDHAPEPDPPRLGIDVTCVSEPSRRPTQITTLAQFSDWVDVFTEVFSAAEIRDMKAYIPPPLLDSPRYTPGDSRSERQLVVSRLRNFYTFFALKEAYIKMTGEALLAAWLKELEFRNVRVPAVAGEGQWGEVERGVEVWFRGERVREARVEVVGFGGQFVVALVAKGLGDQLGEEGSGAWLGKGMREVDIEGEVRACAEGSCGCLND